MPLFTLIIPTFNRSTLLRAALDSVLRQEFSDYELIVVDDGSTDDTEAVLAEYAQRLGPEKFRALSQANAGQGAARNLAIDQAAGEYCAFLDSDDLLFPWSFAVVAEAIERHGHPPLIFGNEFKFETDAEHAAVPREPLRTETWRDLYAFASTHRLAGPGAVAAKTQVIREAGKFLVDRVVGEDVDLLYRLGTLSPMIRIEAPPTIGYRLHDEQFTTNTDKWDRGACSLIERCKAGVFPGGPGRRAEIRKLICREIMLFSLVCLYWGGRGTWICAKLYVRTLVWQLQAGHFGFIVKTPLCIALRLLGLWPIRPTHRAKFAARRRRDRQPAALAS